MSSEPPSSAHNGVYEFLLREYSTYQEAFAKNEELGERRVQFFLGLVTAAVGGLGFLATAERGIFAVHPEYLLWVAPGLLSLLLAAGLMTYDRLLKRDQTTKEYQDLVDEIRARIIKSNVSGQGVSLAAYKPFSEPPGKRLKRIGRLGRFLLVINAWLAGTMTFLLYLALNRFFEPQTDPGAGTTLAIVVGGSLAAIFVALLASLGQWGWWKRKYRA